jgi:hypothetical protein
MPEPRGGSSLRPRNNAVPSYRPTQYAWLSVVDSPVRAGLGGGAAHATGCDQRRFFRSPRGGQSSARAPGDRAEALRRYSLPVVSHLPGVGENLQDHCFIVGFVAETKAPMAPGSRAGSHLFFRSGQATDSPDLQALLATAAVGAADVKPDEGFAIRLGLLRPQSRGAFTPRRPICRRRCASTRPIRPQRPI